MLAVVTLASACAGRGPTSLFGVQDKLMPEDYDDILARWTRADRIYQGFDTKLFATATFHAPELRRAFAIAFPEIYGHGGVITRRELVDLTGDVEQFHNLFVSVYTANDKWNDLAQPDSIWRVTLIGAGEVAVGPASIETVKIDANISTVYPYISRFDKAYLVRFPLTDGMGRLVLDPSSNRVTLRIASALGVAEMQWDLAPAETPRSDPPSSARGVPGPRLAATRGALEPCPRTPSGLQSLRRHGSAACAG